MLPSILIAALLVGRSVASTYDFCQGYFVLQGNEREIFNVQLPEQPCIEKCDATADCQTIIFDTRTSQYSYCFAESFRPTGSELSGPINQPFPGGEEEYLALGYQRSDPLVPAQTNLPGTCVVCRTETCFNCIAPKVFSTTGDCLDSCPAGQTANGGGGCVCDTPGCDCVAPEYYSTESGACMLPTVVTSTITESASTTEIAKTTTTPPTSTITIVETSTTTPATSTITAVTTSSTGRTNCASIRATFPAACCPNKYDANLRPVSAGKLRRRALQSTTTSTTTTVTSTSTTTETIVAPTPLTTTSTTAFAEAPTPLTTTSTTAFAQSTNCVVETPTTGLAQCPPLPKPVIAALLSSYRKSGKKFFIDCGAAGMFELA